MQSLRQKKGQTGLSDATAQNALGGAGFFEADEQRAAQLRDVIGLAVGEWVLGGVPGGFDRIEFRCVGGQFLQVQTRVLVTERLQPFAIVDRGAVPDDDDVATQMLEQMPEKVLHLVARDILGVQLEVESEPSTLRTDRQAADDRDTGMIVAVAEKRRLTDPPPGAPDSRNQHEAGFVGEDDVSTQPRSVFSTRGQSLRFHSSMRPSFRSSARLSGFWQLKPNSCSSRAA